jgi:hypothetical protein
VLDSSLLTHFIAYHFASNAEAYVPFSHWVDLRVQEDLDVAVCVEEWLSHLEGSASLQTMEKVVDNNMCNKTCAEFDSGKSPAQAKQLFPMDPTPSSHARWQQPEGLQDIRTMFPLALKRTPAQVAVDHVIKTEIAL